VQSKTIVPVLVHGVTFADLLQAVAHEKLIEPGGEERGRDVDQNGDPGVGVKRESTLTCMSRLVKTR